MTNREKFKEVFGFNPDLESKYFKNGSMCSIMSCNDKDTCIGCIFDENDDPDDEYRGPETRPVVHACWCGTQYGGSFDDGPNYAEWRCSNCGTEYKLPDIDYAYCPHCGAKMDKEEHDECSETV